MSFVPYQQVKKPFKRKKPDSDKLRDVELTNRFDPLSDESMEDDGDQLQEQELNKDKPKKIPPIVIYGEVDKIESIAKMQENMKGKLNLKCKPNKTIIFTENYEDFAVVEKEISDASIEYHTYTKEKDKVTKLVIKGLPTKVSIKFIKEELTKNNIHATEVKQMVKKSQEGDGVETKIPVFIVTFPPNVQIKDIFQVRRLCYCVIRWEKFKNRRDVIQCYNCQAFGHISNNCHKTPKCLKCAGDHNSRDCAVTEKIENPKCINCGGDHVASDENCIVYQKALSNRRRRNTQQEITENTHTRNYTTRQHQRTGLYSDVLHNSRHQSTNSTAGPSVGGSNNNHQEHNSSSNNNGFSGVIEDIKNIYMLFKSINISHVLNVIKETFCKIKNERDTLSKVAIFLEGIFDILP